MSRYLMLGGSGVGSSFGEERDSSSVGRGFDPGSGRPLPIGWVSVRIM